MSHIIDIWKVLVEWFFWFADGEFLGRPRMLPPLWKELLVRTSIAGGAAYLLYLAILHYGGRIYVP